MISKIHKIQTALKHAKHFTNASHPAAKGLMFTANGQIFMTNNHCLVQINNAHDHRQWFIQHPKGHIIDYQFPNIDRMQKAAFPNFAYPEKSYFITVYQKDIEDFHKITSGLSKFVESRSLSWLEMENGLIYLNVKNIWYSIRLLFLTDTQQNFNFEEKRHYNPIYIFNTIHFMKDLGSASVRVEIPKEPNTPLIFHAHEDATDEVSISILPILKQGGI